MEKVFANFTWENSPSTNTPLSAYLLNSINNALDTVDTRVVNIVNVDEINLKSGIDGNANAIAALNSTVTAVSADIAKVNSELGQVTVRVKSLEGQIDEEVIKENRQKFSIAAQLGYEKPDDSSETIIKHSQLLHITDVHNDLVSLRKAILLANEIPTIEGILVTGDTVETRYTQSQLEAFSDIMTLSTKPYYPVIGNHDARGASNNNLYKYYVKPAVDKFAIPADDNYYFVDLANIRLIVLHEFELPRMDDITSEIWARAISVDQLRWFIETLNTVPTGLGVVVAIHTPVQKGNMENLNTMKFAANDTDISNWYWDSYMSPNDCLCQIINAYTNKTANFSMTVSYNAAIGADTQVVTANFSKRKGGAFLGWIGGHNHRDYIWKATNYSNQYNIMPVCSSADLSQMQWADMSKDITGSNIAFNILTFDPAHNYIDILRLGTDCGLTQWETKFEQRDYERLYIKESE